MDVLRRGVRPRQILTRDGARERHRRGGRHRRLDQRGAAPARDRQRSAACRSTSTTSTASTRACRCSRISSRAAASSPPICIAPAASRWSRSGCSKAAICTPTRSPDLGPDDRRARAAKRPRRRTRWSCGRCESDQADRRPGHPEGQPRAGRRGGQGRRLRHHGHTGPARVFDSEEAAFEAVRTGAITPGDVVVIRYEGPSGGPGMREMLGVTAAIMGAGPRRFGGARHRRPLLRRDPRADGRPRRAGSGARAGRSPRCATATSSPSISTARTLSVERRRRSCRSARAAAAAAAARHLWSDGEIRAAGVVGRAGSDNRMSSTTGQQPGPPSSAPARRSSGNAWSARASRRLRLLRRRHPAGLRRDARLPDPPRPGAPRAGRHAHGRRLRARQRQGRRRHRHLGPRRDQHGHRHRHRDDGLGRRSSASPARSAAS